MKRLALKDQVVDIWTRPFLAKLGKISDAALAKEMGVYLAKVRKKRVKLGIPASRRVEKIRWTPDMIAMLGKVPDGDIAEIYRVNILTVFQKRHALGINCYARKSKSWHYWTKKEIALLGKMPDGEVALKTGIKKASVAWKRGKLGIPSFIQKRPKKLLSDWTAKEIRVLGTMTDAAAAAKLGIAPTAVRLKRLSLGIPAYGRRSAK